MWTLHCNMRRKQTGKPAGVVGYCYGGTLAWLSAARLSPAAAVGYYGGQIARFAQEIPRVPVLLHFGNAFNNDTRASYNAEAAKEAMARTLAFFNRHL